MKRVLKWLGIVLGVLVLAVLAIPFFINVDDFRPSLEARLTTALGREVKLGNLRLRLLQGEVTADDLSVAEDPAFGKSALLKPNSGGPFPKARPSPEVNNGRRTFETTSAPKRSYEK